MLILPTRCRRLSLSDRKTPTRTEIIRTSSESDAPHRFEWPFEIVAVRHEWPISSSRFVLIYCIQITSRRLSFSIPLCTGYNWIVFFLLLLLERVAFRFYCFHCDCYYYNYRILLLASYIFFAVFLKRIDGKWVVDRRLSRIMGVYDYISQLKQQ